MSVFLNQVKQDMASLSLSAASLRLDDLLTEAQARELTYQEFLCQLLRHEVSSREEKQMEKKLKWAAFSEYKTLEQFDLVEQRSLSKRQLNQLKELHWLEQAYNLILLGPPGVGNYAKYLLM